MFGEDVGSGDNGDPCGHRSTWDCDPQAGRMAPVDSMIKV